MSGRAAEDPHVIYGLAVDLTAAAAALDYVTSDPDQWGAFLVYANARSGGPKPREITREGAAGASGRLAAIAIATIKRLGVAT